MNTQLCLCILGGEYDEINKTVVVIDVSHCILLLSLKIYKGILALSDMFVNRNSENSIAFFKLHSILNIFLLSEVLIVAHFSYKSMSCQKLALKN